MYLQNFFFIFLKIKINKWQNVSLFDVISHLLKHNIWAYLICVWKPYSTPKLNLRRNIILLLLAERFICLLLIRFCFSYFVKKKVIIFFLLQTPAKYYNKCCGTPPTILFCSDNFVSCFLHLKSFECNYFTLCW